MPQRRLNRSRASDALLVGVLWSVTAVAVLYGLSRTLGFAFAPFAAMDWLARVAPGGVLTRAIDGMVSLFHGLAIEPLSAAAKLTEQAIGIAAVSVMLTGAAAVVYFVVPARRRSAVLTGAFTGAAAGGLLEWITLATRRQAGASDVVFTGLILVTWGGLVGWTAWRIRRPVTGTVATRADRRWLLLRVVQICAAGTVTGLVAGLAAVRRPRDAGTTASANPAPNPFWSATNPLPNAGAVPRPAPGTRPELTPVPQHYRIDINTVPPRIDGDSWRLRIGGLVRNPQTLSLADLQQREVRHEFITLSCISNPIAGSLTGTTRWTGVPLVRLLDEVVPDATATHLRIRSADGFDEIVAIDRIRADSRIMLAYAWDGRPLATEHGYPLRIYIPDHYGMKQPKWIEEIVAIDRWEPGYWVRRGWDREARMRATSVIDTTDPVVEAEEEGSSTVVVLGGIAHAGARGISRVEVRVDEGDWTPAQLREPLSALTWVLWRYEWPRQPGRHTVTVRCVDGQGQPQVTSPSPPHPDGATGLHQIAFTA
ncbi:MAG: molybdopterin-dependent oxidoreductase [Vicinamibacterales bacterium]